MEYITIHQKKVRITAWILFSITAYESINQFIDTFIPDISGMPGIPSFINTILTIALVVSFLQWSNTLFKDYITKKEYNSLFNVVLWLIPFIQIYHGFDTFRRKINFFFHEDNRAEMMLYLKIWLFSFIAYYLVTIIGFFILPGLLYNNTDFALANEYSLLFKFIFINNLFYLIGLYIMIQMTQKITSQALVFNKELDTIDHLIDDDSLSI